MDGSRRDFFFRKLPEKRTYGRDMKMEKNRRVSESIRLGTILALTGGFLDAYSYMMRGGAFANAETGNIVMMGISLAQGNWMRALYYLVPVAAFAFGVYAAEKIRALMGENPKVHWKEGVLWFEIFLIFIAGWIPQEFNAAVNSMIAFCCAMQVETFRKIRGKAFATTMCTGNLRSGTELLFSGEYRHDVSRRRDGLHYYWIDLVFVGGAAAGSAVCRMAGEKAVWFCCVSLLAGILFIRSQKRNAEV